MQKETLSQFSPTDEGMVIYEDEKVRAIIPNNASAKGQVTLYSKKKASILKNYRRKILLIYFSPLLWSVKWSLKL